MVLLKIIKPCVGFHLCLMNILNNIVEMRQKHQKTVRAYCLIIILSQLKQDYLRDETVLNVFVPMVLHILNKNPG